MQQIQQVTQYLMAYQQGDKTAINLVVDCLYDQLCKMANSQLHKYNQNTSMGAELVHELYLKINKSNNLNAQNRQHFLAISATAMRQIIIDQIKAKNSIKRGKDMVMTTLSNQAKTWVDNHLEILAVDEALHKLMDLEPTLASVVECKYFAGYTETEIAEALNISERTVRRHWQRAKKWLALELGN
ncbi:ECF-type sigma factor [Marinicella rhabdoformis]|uniref:ECF-type sigma factor n=1 Tax=Marinicella rhabdoformis TaxID=2580566 RepID=UPI0012AED58F|nr:ECF-type sigma factor [Marinicella rhabdoformis]